MLFCTIAILAIHILCAFGSLLYIYHCCNNGWVKFNDSFYVILFTAIPVFNVVQLFIFIGWEVGCRIITRVKNK